MKYKMALLVIALACVIAACGSTDQTKPTAHATKTATTSQKPVATQNTSAAPKPVPPNLTTRAKAKKFFDGLEDNIDWKSAPTPKERPRYLGIASGVFATIEIFGPPKFVDEIAYQSVFEGTSQDVNFDRALPMIRIAQKYASEKAAKFVGAQLDDFTNFEAIPQQSRTKKFGNIYVRVIGIDVINTVNMTISIGHRPS